MLNSNRKGGKIETLLIKRIDEKPIISNKAITLSFIGTGLVMVVYICTIWNNNHDSDLSKLGVIASVLGLWIATYIAIWLINQNRKKNIEENYVYKIQLLTNLESALHSIWNVLFYAKSNSVDETNDKLRTVIKQSEEDFQYWTSRINLANQNTYVPPKIRDLVSMLIHQGVKAIYDPNMAIEYPDFLDRVVFLYLDKIIDSKYMAQSDETVDHFLNMVKESRNSLANLIMKEAPQDEEQ